MILCIEMMLSIHSCIYNHKILVIIAGENVNIGGGKLIKFLCVGSVVKEREKSKKRN